MKHLPQLMSLVVMALVVGVVSPQGAGGQSLRTKRPVPVPAPAPTPIEPVPKEAWLMWRGNPQRHGYARSADNLDVTRLTTRWSHTAEELKKQYQCGWMPNSSPVIADGKVVIAIEDIIDVNAIIVQARIFTFDLKTGEVVWEKVIEEPGWPGTADTNNFATPVIHNGYVYQITGTGRLVALSLETGENKNPDKWPNPLAPQGQGHLGGSAFDPSPAIVDGKLLICSDTMFYLIDLTTDEIVAEMEGIENFALDDQQQIVYGVYGTEPRWGVPQTTQGVRAYRLADILASGAAAQPLWDRPLPLPDSSWNTLIMATPVYAAGQVLVATTGYDAIQQTLYSVDAATGVVNWSLPLPGQTFGTGAVDLSGPVLYQPSGLQMLQINLRPGIEPVTNRVLRMLGNSGYSGCSPPFEYLTADLFIGTSPTLANGIVYAFLPFDQPSSNPGCGVWKYSGIDPNTGLLPYVNEGRGGGFWTSPAVTDHVIVIAEGGGVVCLIDQAP